MKRKIFLAVAGLLVLAAALGGVKYMQINRMIDAGARFSPPPETVTAAEARTQTWESVLTAVGSVSAVQGVTVAAELPGKVVEINFRAGDMVDRGDLLLQQDVSTERAQLPGAEAEAGLARDNLERLRKLLEQKFISQAEFDDAEANFRLARAVADNIRAAISKKTIHAPFQGRLGIRQVNLGQVLKEGDPIVSLQTLNPVFVDFSLPQQALGRLRPGLLVRATSDAYPGMVLEGTLNAVSPQVDAATRNVQVQATLENSREVLRPGMFVNVALVLPERREVLAIPATAVLYAPYGNSVFVIEDAGKDQPEKDGKVLRQQFVRLGEKQGDFIQVLSGLEAGENVVSTGVFKFRNGQAVVIDNSLAPDFELTPEPQNN